MVAKRSAASAEEMKKVRKLLVEIEKRKARISADRDALRESFADLEDILDSLDEGIHEIESGTDSIERGLDSISQHL